VRITGTPSSNNTAELVAIALARHSWSQTSLHIHTDSKYALGLLEGGLLSLEHNSWLDIPWITFPPRRPATLLTSFLQFLLYLLCSHQGSCHVPCHLSIFPFIFICSHSSLLFISIFRYSFPFSVHSPVSDSSAHVSGLLSVLRVPYISRVLVLDCSGLITCIVSLSRWFTLATISYGAPFVITCSLLPCSGLVWPFFFHMYLLPFASSCHFSFTI